MKNALALLLVPLLRFYIRYCPLPFGKRWLYTSVIDPYLSWRPYSTLAKMRAGPRVEVQLPDQIQGRIYYFGVWEPEVTEYITSALEPGDCFVDVGANIGYFSLLAASLVGAGGKVISIEASPMIHATLERNVARSGLTNIVTHHKAVADKPSKLQIFLGPAENRGATTTLASVATRKQQRLEGEVMADTLPAIVGDELYGARLIKIDIEGAEYLLFAGISQVLSQFSPRTEWLVEITPQALQEQGQSVAELFEMFRSADYELFRIRNDYADASYFGAMLPPSLEPLAHVPNETVDILARRRSTGATR